MADEPNRRRRRATAAQGPPPERTQRVDPPAQPVEPQNQKKPRQRDAVERGLRDIVGSGPSALSESAALRARELNRPTDEDIAEAERTVALVRRNWKPPS